MHGAPAGKKNMQHGWMGWNGGHSKPGPIAPQIYIHTYHLESNAQIDVLEPNQPRILATRPTGGRGGRPSPSPSP